jgi:bacteriocin biosynthesis cyclodehydratase domain-containing protein
MQRPRLKITTEIFTSPAGDLCVLRPSAGSDLVLQGAGERERKFLAALDGRNSRTALDADFGAEAVAEVLDLLDSEGLVEDAAAYDTLTHGERARYDRQLRYFADIAPDRLTAADCQVRLRDAHVLVLGVGGLGSWAALSLACCGVGRLTLVDGDEVELSNLNRQVLYTPADIGRPKVRVAAEAIDRFNPDIELVPVERTLGTAEEIAGAVRGSSLVVDAADRPAHDIERWVNAACFERRVPYITMSHFPPFARVGPLYVPGETGCFNCQERAYRKSYELYDHIVEQRRATPSPAATLGPACALVGGQVALDVVHQLTGLCEPASKGRVRVFDTRTLEVSDEPVPHDPECEVCGGYGPAHDRLLRPSARSSSGAEERRPVAGSTPD